MFMLKARAHANCHLLWRFAHGDPHQIITYSVGLRTIAVECSCGRHFGIDAKHRASFLAIKAAGVQFNRRR